MESIGKKLQTAREENNYTIEQVARETNISRRYIVALEAEAFDEFPGETYLYGFLRNYSDYLGLNPDELVTLYKNYKVQEQPLPMQELLDVKGKGINPLFIVVPVLVIVIAAAVYFLTPSVGSFIAGQTVNGQTAPQNSSISESSPAAGEESLQQETTAGFDTDETPVLDTEPSQFRLFEGDTIELSIRDSNISLSLESIGVVIQMMLADARIGLSAVETKAEVDVDNDGSADVLVSLVDMGNKADGVKVALQLLEAEPTVDAEEPFRMQPGMSAAESRLRDDIVIGEYPSKTAIEMFVRVTGATFLRTISDTNPPVDEVLRETERTIRAENNLFIGLSSASNAEVYVKGERVEFNSSDASVTKLFTWNYNEATGRYRLECRQYY